MERLCNLGAKVVFGDIQAEAGEKQAQKLSAFPVKFVKTDVTIYEDLLALFDTALKAYGKIDCCISNAGVAETGNWFDPELDLEGIKKACSAIPPVFHILIYIFTLFSQIGKKHANPQQKRSPPPAPST